MGSLALGRTCFLRRRVLNMKMDVVAGSQNDEFYTPGYAVAPILRYISTAASVLCPFDTSESLFVRMLRSRGNKVTYTHLSAGFDFFQMPLNSMSFDFIVSNPPYSKKFEVFNKLFESNKSFAMLVGVVGLFESAKRFDMFKQNQFEIMYFNKRVSYFKNYDDEKPSLNPPFSSVYVCRGLLPRQIVFETL
jgi:hypothetical protein